MWDLMWDLDILLSVFFKLYIISSVVGQNNKNKIHYDF